jgi:hypothetical protein
MSKFFFVTIEFAKLVALFRIGFTNLIKSIMMQAILYGALPEVCVFLSHPISAF